MRTRRKSAGNTIKFLQDYETLELFNQINLDTSRHVMRNKAIFYLAKYCALRASEIGLISIDDYYPKTNEIYIKRLKGSQNNTIQVVNPDVLSALNEYYELRMNMNIRSKSLFVSQKGTPINRRTLDLIMKKYCEGTHIPIGKRHFHVLKHTRAMELVNEECPIQDVQWYLGHRSITNTMIYLTFTSTAKRKLFNHLAEKEGESINWEKVREYL